MSEDAANAPLTVRVAEELKSALDEKYEDRGFTNRSDYIRYVLRNAVEEEATVTEDQAEELRKSRAQAQRGETYTEAEVAEELGLEPDFLDHDDDSGPDTQHIAGQTTNSDTSSSKIAVIGCGGAGLRLVSRLHAVGIANAETLVVEADDDNVQDSKADTTVRLDESELDHFNNLDLNSTSAAKRSLYNAIQSIIGDVDHVFIVTGIGGKTGTYLSPYIADFISDSAVVTTVGTLPFSDVEPARLKRARQALPTFQEVTDTLVLVDGSNMVDVDKDKPLGQTVRIMNHRIASLLSHICDHFTRFQFDDEDADISTLLENGGLAFIIDSTFGAENMPTELSSMYSPRDITSDAAEFALLDFRFGSGIEGQTASGIASTLREQIESLGWVETTGRPGEGIYDVLGLIGGVSFDGDIRSLLDEPSSDLEMELVDSAIRSRAEMPPAATEPGLAQGAVADGGLELPIGKYTLSGLRGLGTGAEFVPYRH